MDDIVKQAMAKWPNVPACAGWLGLGARGDWYLRDEAAQAAVRAVRGEEGLSGLDMACDNLLLDFAHATRQAAFGPKNVIGYLLAVDAELVAVRTVISGRMSGMKTEQIVERLRKS